MRPAAGGCARVALGTALLAAALAPGVRAEDRLARARVRLEGPLEELVLDLGRPGSTRVRLALAAGERRELELPLPALRPPASADPPPEWTAHGAGRAEFLGWSAEPGAGSWSALPPGLRARARPPVAGAGGPPPSAFLVLGAALVLGIGWRRRAWLGLGAGLLAAGLLLLGPSLLGAAVAGPTTVLEGDGGPTWLRVRSGGGVLELEEGTLRLETEPEGVPLAFEVDARGRPSWTVRAARDVRLAAFTREAAAPRGELGDLAAAWVRGCGARGPAP